MLESRIEARLRRGVERLGGKALKWVSPGNSGVPDRIVILPKGRVYFVELKQLTGKAGQLQIAQHRRLKRLGCRVYVTPGAEAVDKFLEEVGGGADGVQPP